jgi:hypothetical protein
MARRRAPRTPFTNEPDALELIGRLLVGSSYRVPVEGTGTKAGLQASEIAAAIGYMSDPLEREVAIAVATRAGRVAIAKLAMNAYRHVARDVRLIRTKPLQLSKPADRWRLRLVVYDVCTELVWPDRRRPLKDLAKESKMRVASYCIVHKCAMATLQQSLNNGRREFGRRLWGNK